MMSSTFSDHNTNKIRNQLGKSTRNQQEKKAVKNTYMWRLNNMLLNSQRIAEVIKEEIKKYLDTNDNKSMMIQTPWDIAKAVLRRKFIAMKSYLRKKLKNSNNQLNFTSKASREK